MVGCDMSFTLAALNPIQRHGQAVNQCSSSQMILRPVKSVPVVWEKLHKGFMPCKRQRTCLHQASHGVHYTWQSVELQRGPIRKDA